MALKMSRHTDASLAAMREKSLKPGPAMSKNAAPCGCAVMAFTDWSAIPNTDVAAVIAKPRRKQNQKPKVIVDKYAKQVAALEQQARKRQQIQAAKNETRKQSLR